MAQGALAADAFGFMTVVDDEQHGLFGGYLILNARARPVEFHCTAPIRPNRAQKILYGPTLEPYLYGEQIGQSLFASSSSAPRLVFTDQVAMLALQPLASVPVLLLMGVDSSAPTGSLRLQAGTASFAMLAEADHLADSAQRELESFGAGFDFAEPFGRIRGAIDEAQRSRRSASAAA